MATTTVWQALILLGCQNFLATFGTASFTNMLQDISTPQIRGKISGLNASMVALACIPGPLVVGMISDSLASDGSGLLSAILIVSIPALLFSAFASWRANPTFIKTVMVIRETENQLATT
jgi:MFS family permease